MKKIIFLAAAIAFSLCGYSQIYTPVNPTTYGEHKLRLKADSAQHIPEKLTLVTNTTDTSAQIFINKLDSSVWYYYKPIGFVKIAGSVGGGGGIWGAITGTLADQTDLQFVLD